MRFRLALPAAVVATVALLAAAPAGAAAPAVSIRLGVTSQRALLASGGVRVRVKVRRASTVRLSALVRGTGAAPGRTQPAAGKRVLHFARAGTRSVLLPLSRSGRAALAACAGRRLTVAAGVTPARSRARGGRRGPIAFTGASRSARASVLLRIDSARCVAVGARGIPTADAARCDFIDPALCLLPFPNDYFTRTDGSTDSGRRLDLQATSMPRNALGKPIEPGDYNRSDGFSPGALIATKVPGMDTPAAFERTGTVPITDMRRSFDREQPVVVINTRTGKRQLIWAELDSNAANPADVDLLIHPATNLDEGTRYVVALRGMKDAAGRTLEAGAGFRAYRDRLITGDRAIEARRGHFESIFGALARSGIARDDLYLAWDFTVASRRSLSERELAIRDDAFAQLGDHDLTDLKVTGAAPSFAVTGVQDFLPCDPGNCQQGQDPYLARQVQGQFVVPCYLNLPGCPSGSRFQFQGASNRPQRLPGNVYSANFICDIPRAAVAGGSVHPARPSLYGHGLFGSASEVGATNVKQMADEHDFVFCATDWIGMSQNDLPNTLGRVLTDLSNFPELSDRVQQGWVNFGYLGRLLDNPAGFASSPAFQFPNGGGLVPVIDTKRLFYDGNSQGGILGGGLTAVAPDFDRAVLGVPGMNFSTLIPRSSDAGPFTGVLFRAYPNEAEHPLILSLVQTLFDHGEADGYAHHMTSDPLPNTPPHEVLLHEAFGDHQVANVTTEVEARTIGASLRVPPLVAGRSTFTAPFYGIPAIRSFPFDGSALVVFDTGPLRTENGQQVGTPPPPNGDTPPNAGEDPHEAPRNTVTGRRQKSDFLQIGGQVTDPCGTSPCYAGSYRGP